MDANERIIELLEKIINQNENRNYLLEKIAQNRGSLSQDNENKIKEKLHEEGKLTKQEICKLLNISTNSATKIMQKISCSDIIYIPGIGRKCSSLIYIKKDSMEEKAYKLLKNMKSGSTLSRSEAVNYFDLKDENELRNIVNIAISLFGKEISWHYGKLVR